MGRRRPYVLFGGLACGLLFSLVWHPPLGWTQNSQFAYFAPPPVPSLNYIRPNPNKNAGPVEKSTDCRGILASKVPRRVGN